MAAFPDELNGHWRRSVRKRLLDWYSRHARTLPWRESADPYLVWVSEIMLQQTTIAAVRPYFERFRQRFPTVQDLAAASESEVLHMWEGLGYYSRARNLHRAAGKVVSDYQGMFPESVSELQSLPGIGPYTARAVASVAFAAPVGILEANTLRLYSRLIELDEDPRSGGANRLLWDFADWIVDANDPSQFNQAAMDLGSTVCTPDKPDCEHCPLQRSCRAFRTGRQHELPVLPKKQTMTDVTDVAFVLCRRGKVLLKQYAEGERWAGLWDFLRFSIPHEQGDVLLGLPQYDHGQQTLFTNEATDLAARLVAEQCGLQLQSPRMVQKIRHTVTRYRIRLLCLTAESIRGTARRDSKLVWRPVTDLQSLPLSTTARRIAETASLFPAGE